MSSIDNFLIKKNLKRKIRPPHVLYVTDLTTPCLRSTYFGILENRQHPIETLRIFEAGNILEDYWIQILKNHEDMRVIETQVPAYFSNVELEIHGRVDALCQHKNSFLVAHEIKTAQSSHWLKEAKDNHVEQLQFYLNRLSINHGQIDYLDKEALLKGENPIDRSFFIEADPAVFATIVKKAHEITKSLGSKIPPSANKEAWNGRICEYCLYKDLCEKLIP